jgi:uncharacterized protein YkwD
MPTTPSLTDAATGRRQRRRRWPWTFVAGPLVAAALPAAAPADVRAGAHESVACANQSLVPTAHDTAQVSGAIVCLVNAIRARYGIQPLLANRALNSSAMGHSRDMVARDYFSHDTPAGSTPAQRMRRSGAPCSQGCELGENIAWASGSLSTPAAIVQAWMSSPGHRANILDPAFRYEGVGVAEGSPAMLDHNGLPGTTVTEDFVS